MLLRKYLKKKLIKDIMHNHSELSEFEPINPIKETKKISMCTAILNFYALLKSTQLRLCLNLAVLRSIDAILES